MTRLRSSAVLLPLALIAAVAACARRAAEPPAAEPPAAVVLGGPTESMAVGDDGIPPPRVVPRAGGAIKTDDPEAMEVFAIAAENGTWKFQHPNGVRERNELHLPVGRPVKLTLTSEVRGACFGLGWRHLEIPAFPLTARAWGGRYTQAAVKPTRTGAFGLWNAGARVGTVFVVETVEYDRLTEGEPGKSFVGDARAWEGKQLFLKLQCTNCHTATPSAKAPVLEGLYGTKVKLKGGAAVIADEAYLVESIRRPRLKVVDGWEAIMPAYDEEQATAEELDALVAYIRSLKKGDPKPNEERFPPPVGAPTERPQTAPPPREK